MKDAENGKKYFTNALMKWHSMANRRSLPWKEEKDPYKIWLSEVILQQTRAQQGLPYYLRFTETYPTLKKLAAANDLEVFRLWQGLGYYNRCKNMLATARHIVHKLNGRFPKEHEGLLQLKGIGPYTAAAIASFAYGLPHAVVDGNVYRVLSRYFGIDTPFDSTAGKKTFKSLAQELLYTKDSGAYNQAIMDLGATVCTPALPKCGDCPLQKNCIACNRQLIPYLPVRSKKPQVTKRYFHYILLQYENKIWLHKRSSNDIWQNLYEPLLIEHGAPLDTILLQKEPHYKKLKITVPKPIYEGKLIQKLTHQIIESHFFTLPLRKPFVIGEKDGEWVALKDLNKIAFPKTIVSFLEKKSYF